MASHCCCRALCRTHFKHWPAPPCRPPSPPPHTHTPRTPTLQLARIGSATPPMMLGEAAASRNHRSSVPNSPDLGAGLYMQPGSAGSLEAMAAAQGMGMMGGSGPQAFHFQMGLGRQMGAGSGGLGSGEVAVDVYRTASVPNMSEWVGRGGTALVGGGAVEGRAGEPSGSSEAKRAGVGGGGYNKDVAAEPARQGGLCSTARRMQGVPAVRAR